MVLKAITPLAATAGCTSLLVPNADLPGGPGLAGSAVEGNRPHVTQVGEEHFVAAPRVGTEAVLGDVDTLRSHPAGH